MRNPFKRDHEKDAKQVSDELKKADYEGVSNEEIMSTDQVVDKMGLPTTWEGGDDPVHIRGNDAIIQPASGADLASYTRPPRLVCGQCKFFDLEKGRKEMIRQRFAEVLTQDYEWNPAHLGAPLDTIGMCGMADKMLCSTMTEACDQFRPKK